MEGNLAVKMAAVGDTASVMLFGTLGITPVGVDGAEETEREVKRLIKEGYDVIYITEKSASLIPALIERYRSKTKPAIIPIPDRNGTDGSSREAVSRNVEKAIGRNIF